MPRPGRFRARRQSARDDRGPVLSGRIAPVVIAFAVGFLVLAGVFFAIDTLAPSKQPGDADTHKPAVAVSIRGILKSVAPFLRERCAKSARAALAQHSIDSAGDDVGTKIDSYCACAVDRSLDEMSIGEFLAFKFNQSSEPAASKMKNIMQKCQETIGQ